MFWYLCIDNEFHRRLMLVIINFIIFLLEILIVLKPFWSMQVPQINNVNCHFFSKILDNEETYYI